MLAINEDVQEYIKTQSGTIPKTIWNWIANPSSMHEGLSVLAFLMHNTIPKHLVRDWYCQNISLPMLYSDTDVEVALIEYAEQEYFDIYKQKFITPSHLDVSLTMYDYAPFDCEEEEGVPPVAMCLPGRLLVSVTTPNYNQEYLATDDVVINFLVLNSDEPVTQNDFKIVGAQSVDWSRFNDKIIILQPDPNQSKIEVTLTAKTCNIPQSTGVSLNKIEESEHIIQHEDQCEDYNDDGEPQTWASPMTFTPPNTTDTSDPTLYEFSIYNCATGYQRVGHKFTADRVSTLPEPLQSVTFQERPDGTLDYSKPIIVFKRPQSQDQADWYYDKWKISLRYKREGVWSDPLDNYIQYHNTVPGAIGALVYHPNESSNSSPIYDYNNSFMTIVPDALKYSLENKGTPVDDAKGSSRYLGNLYTDTNKTIPIIHNWSSMQGDWYMSNLKENIPLFIFPRPYRNYPKAVTDVTTAVAPKTNTFIETDSTYDVEVMLVPVDHPYHKIDLKFAGYSLSTAESKEALTREISRRTNQDWLDTSNWDRLTVKTDNLYNFPTPFPANKNRTDRYVEINMLTMGLDKKWVRLLVAYTKGCLKMFHTIDIYITEDILISFDQLPPDLLEFPNKPTFTRGGVDITEELVPTIISSIDGDITPIVPPGEKFRDQPIPYRSDGPHIISIRFHNPERTIFGEGIFEQPVKRGKLSIIDCNGTVITDQFQKMKEQYALCSAHFDAYRIAAGKAPFVWNDNLARAAAMHGLYMKENSSGGHGEIEGLPFFTGEDSSIRVNFQGYRRITSGEGIWGGSPTVCDGLSAFETEFINAGSDVHYRGHFAPWVRPLGPGPYNDKTIANPYDNPDAYHTDIGIAIVNNRIIAVYGTPDESKLPHAEVPILPQEILDEWYPPVEEPFPEFSGNRSTYEICQQYTAPLFPDGVVFPTIEWSSDIQGPLGTGFKLDPDGGTTVLEPGTHNVCATLYRNSQKYEDCTTVNICGFNIIGQATNVYSYSMFREQYDGCSVDLNALRVANNLPEWIWNDRLSHAAVYHAMYLFHNNVDTSVVQPNGYPYQDPDMLYYTFVNPHDRVIHHSHFDAFLSHTSTARGATICDGYQNMLDTWLTPGFKHPFTDPDDLHTEIGFGLYGDYVVVVFGKPDVMDIDEENKGLIQYTPEERKLGVAGAQGIRDMVQYINTAPTITSHTPDGIGWLSPSDWDLVQWDGVPRNVCEMTCNELREYTFGPNKNSNTMRGLREHYYQINPFADPTNPTVAEIDNWNIEVINHFRSLFGIEKQVVGSPCLFHRAQWGQERKFTTYWDTTYPGRLDSPYGPCVGGRQGHCGSTFLPSCEEQLLYPQLDGQCCGAAAGAEAISSFKVKGVPWSVQLSRVIAGFMAESQCTSGHLGPFFGRGKVGMSWYHNAGESGTFRIKWAGSSADKCTSVPTLPPPEEELDLLIPEGTPGNFILTEQYNNEVSYLFSAYDQVTKQDVVVEWSSDKLGVLGTSSSIRSGDSNVQLTPEEHVITAKYISDCGTLYDTITTTIDPPMTLTVVGTTSYADEYQITATDTGSGGTDVTWTSNLDGELGTFPILNFTNSNISLSIGTHTITGVSETGKSASISLIVSNYQFTVTTNENNYPISSITPSRVYEAFEWYWDRSPTPIVGGGGMQWFIGSNSITFNRYYQGQPVFTQKVLVNGVWYQDSTTVALDPSQMILMSDWFYAYDPVSSMYLSTDTVVTGGLKLSNTPERFRFNWTERAQNGPLKSATLKQKVQSENTGLYYHPNVPPNVFPPGGGDAAQVMVVEPPAPYLGAAYGDPYIWPVLPERLEFWFESGWSTYQKFTITTGEPINYPRVEPTVQKLQVIPYLTLHDHTL